MNTARLIERIENREAVIGVVGLGYVGLPLVLTFARAGFRLVGFDIDKNKIEKLHSGEGYIAHLPNDELAELVRDGQFDPTTDYAKVAECDALMLCVPTPLNKNREPDMSYVEGTAASIAPHLKEGQLIILESTTYPGTTSGPLRELLEAGSHKSAGQDFLLAYSPEREDPGNPNFDTQRIPKVVGALTPEGCDAAVALYRSALDEVVPVSSPESAEMTKLLENIFRSVNIALVNEIKVLCQAMGINVWEVIDAAATKPFGFMPFYPGPGLGGHCIPIDPFYLTWKAREFDLSTRFIELAGEVNSSMPHYVVQKTMEALNTQKKAMNGSRVLVLGVAYKRDVEDVRESPALKIIDLLQDSGAEVSYHDPHVPTLRTMRHYDLGMSSIELNDSALTTHDAVLIVTDHTEIDYKRVVELAPLIVDTRNATRDFRTGLDSVFLA